MRPSIRPRAARSRRPATSQTTTSSRREGKGDELLGKAKGALNDLRDKAEDALDSVKDKVDDVRDKH